MTEGRTRYTRAISLDVINDRIVVTMHFDDHREHLTYTRETARELALKLLRVAELSRPGASRSTPR